MSQEEEQDRVQLSDGGSGGELFVLPGVSSKWDAIHQIFYQSQNYYRVVDVIDALEVAKNPANYWSQMKRRIKTEGFNEAQQGMIQFEVKSSKDQRLRKHDYVPLQALLRLIQSIPSPKVEEGKLWLAKVGEQRLNEEVIERMEAKLEQAREQYRERGMDERWIEERITNLVGRNELTDQWRVRGAIEHLHFAKLTVILHKGALGVTPEEHKQRKNLPKRENPRDHMDRVELALLSLAEATATTKHIENDTQGVEGLEQDAREVAQGSEVVRQITEHSLGRSVVNPINFLNAPKKGRGKKPALPEPKQSSLFESQREEKQ